MPSHYTGRSKITTLNTFAALVHSTTSHKPGLAPSPTAMPSATGSSWEKYTKKFADDEVEEKKITPLTDEYVSAKAVSHDD